MDPKSFPQNLDPKLKEAYDRVMGFAAKPAQTQPASQTPVASDSVVVTADTAGLQSEPKTPAPTFADKTGAQSEHMQSTSPQTTVTPPEATTYPKPQQPMQQYETPPAGPARPVPYQTGSFPNNPIISGPQTPLGSEMQSIKRPIAYQPVTEEPQYPPVSQPISPSPITELSPSSDSAGMQGPSASVPQTVTHPQEKKSPLLTIVIIVLGIIFLLIYAFFWIRFFDVALPFDLPF